MWITLLPIVIGALGTDPKGFEREQEEFEIETPFNCVKTNNWRLIELLVIHKNTWNLLTLLTYVKLDC